MAKPVKHPYKPKVNAWEVVCFHNWNTFESAAPLCFLFILPELLSLVKPEVFRSFWRMPFNSAAKRHRGLNQFRIDFNMNGVFKGTWKHPKMVNPPTIQKVYFHILPFHYFHFSKPICGLEGTLLDSLQSSVATLHPHILLFSLLCLDSEMWNHPWVCVKTTVSTGSLSQVAWIKVACWKPLKSIGRGETSSLWPQRLPHEAVAVPHILQVSIFATSFSSLARASPSIFPTIPIIHPLLSPSLWPIRYKFDPFSRSTSPQTWNFPNLPGWLLSRHHPPATRNPGPLLPGAGRLFAALGWWPRAAFKASR